MREIPLTRGRVALVDDDDYTSLSIFKWHYQTRGYAARSFGSRGNQVFLWIHRIVVNAPPGMQVDHVDGNRLNNQKSNLRVCTGLENRLHVRNCRRGKTSRFKGVHWNSHLSKWTAQITAFQTNRYLGVFFYEEDAARAYDVAAILAFGVFANPNFS